MIPVTNCVPPRGRKGAWKAQLIHSVRRSFVVCWKTSENIGESHRRNPRSRGLFFQSLPLLPSVPSVPSVVFNETPAVLNANRTIPIELIGSDVVAAEAWRGGRQTRLPPCRHFDGSKQPGSAKGFGEALEVAKAQTQNEVALLAQHF